MFFPGTCPYSFLRCAPKAAPATGPLLPLILPETDARPGAEAVALALRTIESAIRTCPTLSSRKACIPFPSARRRRYRLLTPSEARAKMQRISGMDRLDPNWAKDVANELFRETRLEARAPKGAPILDRFTGFVRKIVSDHDGQWTTLPSLQTIANTLSVSKRSIQSVLNQVRETSLEFAFHAEPRRDATCTDRRGRCVRVAFVSWLKYDEKPLLFDCQGQERGIRTSFRPEGSALTPSPDATPPIPPLKSDTESLGPDPSHDSRSVPEASVFKTTTKCNFCLSYSVRLDEPAVLVPNLDRPAHLQFLEHQEPASPELKSDRSALKPQTRLAWGLARELRCTHFGDWDDEETTYHRWRFDLPVYVIQNMISEALGAGRSGSALKTLFESACYEINAAVFDGLAQNPGGLFRTVFRRRWQGQKRANQTLMALNVTAPNPKSPRQAMASKRSDRNTPIEQGRTVNRYMPQGMFSASASSPQFAIRSAASRPHGAIPCPER